MGIEAYMVKQKKGALETIRVYAANEKHQLYVPNAFILGHFRRRKDDFELTDIEFWDKIEGPSALNNYDRLKKEGSLDIVKAYDLPDVVVSTILHQGRSYNAHAKHLATTASSLQKYLTELV